MHKPLLGAASAVALLTAAPFANAGPPPDDHFKPQVSLIVPAPDAKLPPLVPPVPQLAVRPARAGAVSGPPLMPPQPAIYPQRLAALPDLELPRIIPPVPQPAVRPQRLAALPEALPAFVPPVPQPAVPPPRRDRQADRLRTCLKPAARALLERIEAEFGPMQIISTCRPGARIAGTGRISKHATGEAIDFSAGRRKADVVRWLIANHKSGGIMTYADMSHIHVDVGYRFVALNAHSGR
jgi:Peptidase M15